MLTIGLTGGIGSGKSIAAARFRHHGVNADVAVRVVVEPERPALVAIADLDSDQTRHQVVVDALRLSPLRAVTSSSLV